MSTEDLSNVNSAEILAIMESGNVDVAEFDSLNLWERITREDWKKIFPRFPQFADKYQEGYTLGVKWWDILLGKQPALLEPAKKYKVGWAAIIMHYPELESECPHWHEFTAHEWSMIISAQPQFYDKCKCLNKLQPKHWLNILDRQPQFADKCDYINVFNVEDWKGLLARNDNFFETAKKTKDGWAAILIKKPELEDQCPYWNDFSTYHWCHLLINIPQYSSRCNKWSELDYWSYNLILERNPHLWIYSPWESLNKIQSDISLAQQCKCWDWFNRSHWTSLLLAYPQFADKCNKWDHFNSSCWSQLLPKQPQFADKCTIWNDFTSWEWVRILLEQPQFADKCPASAFDEFTQCDWDDLEKKHPFVFEKQRLLSSLRKIADFNA